MSGKCRPSLRPKTLYNVDRSSLSTTDKECIHSVFELADHQKSEIEKNEKIIKAANDLIETQKAEIENLNTVNAEMHESLRLACETNKDMQAEIESLKAKQEKCFYCTEQANKKIGEIKAEAIEEYLNEVKIFCCESGLFQCEADEMILFNYIDSLKMQAMLNTKEMVGEG